MEHVNASHLFDEHFMKRGARSRQRSTPRPRDSSNLVDLRFPADRSEHLTRSVAVPLPRAVATDTDTEEHTVGLRRGL